MKEDQQKLENKIAHRKLARRAPVQDTSQDINVLVSELVKKLHTKRIQVRQQRREIRELRSAGFSAVSAEMLLDRMLEIIDKLCAERERLKRIGRSRSKRIPNPLQTNSSAPAGVNFT
jgi:hypothetical protein